MSICVAVRRGGETWIGSDDQATNGNVKQKSGKKWFVAPWGAVMLSGDMVYFPWVKAFIAEAGAHELGDAQQWWWTFIMWYLSKDAAQDDPRQGLGMEGMLVTRNKIYQISGSGQVLMVGDCSAIGSGMEVALGVFSVTRRMDARSVVRLAVGAAVEHCVGCGGRTHLIEIV